jgi:type I restriction enzyme M protein
LLEPTKQAVVAEAERLSKRADLPEAVKDKLLSDAAGGMGFYNPSRLDFQRLLDDPNNIAQALIGYINAFSSNVREIMERFALDQQIARMNEKNLLYQVVKAFAAVDLSPVRVDNVQMGYVFEELIRIGAEQSNEEAGEHFTPREVIKLMVNLLLSPEQDLTKSHVVKTIYDPACGTGGMLSVAEEYIRELNRTAQPKLYGQDWNDEAWAVCKSDMLIKGHDAEQIKLGDSFTQDQHQDMLFDYMLANPPFGVEWKQQQREIEREHETDPNGRFGAGLPRINDGSLLFLMHMISKMRRPRQGGSRIAIVLNGSPLFTGDAGSGESNIRRWIIENDWLEAIVALPDQLFYNTGISTYVWVLTNRKEEHRKGKVQLIDARRFFVKMRRSLGNKRNKIGDKDEGEPDQIGAITRIHGAFLDGQTWTFADNGATKATVVSKVFDNEDFGFHRITVERPLRLNLQASPERIARIEDETAFKNLASSNKKNEAVRQEEVIQGEKRQQGIRDLISALAKVTEGRLYKDRESFLQALREQEKVHGIRLAASELKAVLSALSERDETAEVCSDGKGRFEPDSELRDTENVPLKQDIEEYFRHEVLPHVPDAWLDLSKTKTGYEIPLNRHFYVYEPPRPLEEIEADIKALEAEILGLLSDVTGTPTKELTS